MRVSSFCYIHHVVLGGIVITGLEGVYYCYCNCLTPPPPPSSLWLLQLKISKELQFLLMQIVLSLKLSSFLSLYFLSSSIVMKSGRDGSHTFLFKKFLL